MPQLAAGELDWLLETENGRFYVLRYFTRRSGHEDATSRLIWAFKNGQAAAVTRVENLVVEGLHRAATSIDEYHFITAAPSSGGPAGRGAEAVCARVASTFGLAHLRGALERVTKVPQAHRAMPGERPTRQTHLDSIRYAGPLLPSDSGVVIFDDIYTTGSTFRACKEIMKEATGCVRVLGLFVGRTQG